MPAPHVGSAILDPVHHGAALADPRHLGSALADPVKAAAGVVWGADPQLYLLRDTFTGTAGTLLTAHTPEDGGPWVAAAWASTGPTFYFRLNGTGGAIGNTFGASGQAVNVGSGDIVMTTTITMNTSIRLYARSNNLAGASELGWFLGVTGTAIILFERVGTSSIQRAIGASLGSLSNLAIAWTLNGLNTTITVNGSAYLTYNATTAYSTYVGIRASDTGVIWHDVEVVDA